MLMTNTNCFRQLSICCAYLKNMAIKRINPYYRPAVVKAPSVREIEISDPKDTDGTTKGDILHFINKEKQQFA